MSGKVLIFAVTALSLLVTSCHSSRKGVSTVNKTTKSVVVSSKKIISGPEPATALADPTKKLLNEANGWLGTPYKYGGNTKSGVDCSGMVCMVFNNALSIKLPRTSAQQGEWCTKINKSDLKPGDLLFFSTTSGSKKISHVGMYIGDGNMIHASTSKGVIVSSLSEAYYVRTYHSCGRVAQYYAMISDKKGNSSSKPKAETKPKESNKKTETPPTKKTETRTDVLLAGGKKLPVSRPEVKKVVATAVKEVVNQSSAKLVAATPGESTRAALEKHRRKVMEEVVEEKIDSIVADFFD